VLCCQLLHLRLGQAFETGIGGVRGELQMGLPQPLAQGLGVDAQHATTVQLRKIRHDTSFG
jgi:hypothetical protein